MPTESCCEELEALGAIFLDDLLIKETAEGRTILSIVIYPATGDDEESRYVTLTLEIELCSEYPEMVPTIIFRNPRGLSDILLSEMERKMAERCLEKLGSEMVFELIDMAKEFLTSNNRPSSECPICLLSFTEYDVFHRSECFHHFHSYCLGKYLQSLEQKELSLEETVSNEANPPKTCPVCREILPKSIDVKFLMEAPPPSEETAMTEEDTKAILSEWKGKKDSLQQLFMKQKSQGGIIDLSERCKNLLVISSPIRNPRLDETGTASTASEIGNSIQSGRPLNTQQPPNRSNHSDTAGGCPATDLPKGGRPRVRAPPRESTSHFGVGAHSHSESGRYHGGHRRRNK